MHVETSVQVIQTVLLQVLVKQRVAIHLAIDAIVSNDVRIQLESTGTCCIVLRICAVARPRIALTYVTHVHILVHHTTISAIRCVHHIAW